MHSRIKIILLSGVGAIIAAMLAFKLVQKEDVVTVEYDLAAGRSSASLAEVRLLQQQGKSLLLELNLSYYRKAQFAVVLQDQPLAGACLNIGDSPGNDGWGGDDGSFSHHAELQVIGPTGALMVYGSDGLAEVNQPEQTGSVKSTILHAEPAFAAPKDSLIFEIADNFAAWSNQRNIKGQKQSPFLYALNGQADTKTGKPSDNLVFAAFNRNIANSQITGDCVKAVKITLMRQ